MTTSAALILGAFLFLTTTAILSFLLLSQNRSSRTPSPTPTSTPATPSADPMLQVVDRMMTMMERMTLPPEIPTEQPQPSLPTFGEMQTTFDYDSTPLSPGIEAVLEREAEETEEGRLLRERAVFQERLAELQAEELRRQSQNGSADSSPGPWSGSEEQFDNLT